VCLSAIKAGDYSCIEIGRKIAGTVPFRTWMVILQLLFGGGGESKIDTAG